MRTAKDGRAGAFLNNRKYSVKGGNYSKPTTLADFSKVPSDYFADFLNFRDEMRKAGYDV